MLRKLALTALGAMLAVLGMIGLVLPILPGVLLLVGAAACFSMVSGRVRIAVDRRLGRNPRYRRNLRRWRWGRGLPLWPRAKLAFWLALASLLPESGRR